MAEAASHLMASSQPGSPWVGRSIARVEDSALLTGRGRFIDDLGVRPGTLHAAILRSPHAHADIVSIDLSAAEAGARRRRGPAWRGHQGADDEPGRRGQGAGRMLADRGRARVRYVGEPSRWWSRPIVISRKTRLISSTCGTSRDLPWLIRWRRSALMHPFLHDGFAGNVASDRTFRYGDPEQAFAAAAHRISIDVRYPRNSCTPIETLWRGRRI